MLATSAERVELPLAEPFGIARGTVETTENVLVRIEDEGGRAGVGAAAPSRRYGETAGTVEAVLPELLSVVEDVDDPLALDRIERRLEASVRGNPAARAAVSVAVHDLAAKCLDLPLYRLWGLDPERTPRTSYTIGLDAVERVRERAAAAVDAGYPILKVKLGSDRDEALIAAVRETAPGATVRVDANEAWAPREAVRKCRLLAEHDVEFVEQPVPAEDERGLRFVHERSPLPIAVDEACATLADVPAVADRADVAVLKPAKCGGLRETRRMIHAARAEGLAVMLGCMVASNAALAASCHLAPLADHADLDGALLLAEDPYAGVDLTDGEVRLAGVEVGTGARPAETEADAD